MTHMFEGVLTGGTGRAAHLDDRPSAGKTGTSQDYRDAWFLGYTADYVSAVWIGNDDNSPMIKATGGGLPARIFKTYMDVAEKDLPPRPLVADSPAEMAQADAAVSGMPAGVPMPPSQKKDLLDVFQNVLDSIF
jgi:penicillin-binding protein 1A